MKVCAIGSPEFGGGEMSTDEDLCAITVVREPVTLLTPFAPVASAPKSKVCDVVCRPIKLNNFQGEIPDRIVELEGKSVVGCEVCIQNVLPHLMEKTRLFEFIFLSF